MQQDNEIQIEAILAESMDKRKTRQVLSKLDLPDDASLFDFVKAYGIERKIIDIAIAQTSLPNELREDAAQEIRITWAMIKPKTGAFTPGQVASYAHRIAKHAVLRLRREIGSAVRLPGSAFRKRKDGSTYVTPGVLSVPLDWNELEGWFDSDEFDSAITQVNNEQGALVHTDEPQEIASTSDTVIIGGQELDPDAGFYYAEDLPAEIRKVISEKLGIIEHYMTSRQRQIADMLIQGYTFEEIQKDLSIRNATIKREMQNVGEIIKSKIKE